MPKYLKYIWNVVFSIALATETSLNEKFWKKIDILNPPKPIEGRRMTSKGQNFKNVQKAEIEYPKPPDPPYYKNTSFVNFDPKLWKFML